MLANFAQRREIGYTLLSDVGSRVIRDLGLLNEHIVQQQAAFGINAAARHFGVPYPGTFILDQAGVVRERWFEQSYRIRPTAVTFLEESFQVDSPTVGVRDTAQSDHVRVTAWLGTSTYHPHQRLNLNIDFNIAPGLHVYTEPIPDGYIPLSAEIEPVEGIEIRPLNLPPSRSLRLEPLNETFYVLDGQVHGRLPVVLTQNVGDVRLSLTVKFQACSDRDCFMPETLTLGLPLQAEDNIRD